MYLQGNFLHCNKYTYAIHRDGFEPCTSVWFEPWFMLILVDQNFPNQTCQKKLITHFAPGVPNPHGLIDVGKKRSILKVF